MGFKLYTEEFKQKVVEAYKSGMKMSEVAETFGVSTSAVSSWASGKKDKRLMFTVEQKKEFVKYRIQHNIPYEDMAKRIGIVTDTLKNWEHDYFFDVMEEIAKENRRFQKKERFGRANWTYVGTGGYFS
jgi:transposase-like protein